VLIAIKARQPDVAHRAMDVLLTGTRDYLASHTAKPGKRK
jgi:hypothetical protein